MILLGAGASRDAGLPLTSELAEILVSRINQDARASIARLRGTTGIEELNFVYSAMIGHLGEDGSDPLRAVNIETLISAVRLLQMRVSHEVAPFVAAWKEGALGFARSGNSSRQYGTEVKRAVSDVLESRSPFAGDRLAEVISEIAIESASERSSKAYFTLESTLLRAIRDVLTDVQTVEYLRPLADLATAQAGGLDVVTLNYDLTVERMAQETGTIVDRGIERWVPGAPLGFERVDGRINLVKLHGSVDWELVERRANSARPPEIKVLETEGEAGLEDPNSPPRRTPGLPWIVVGDREKLATDGPTLDLLYAARDALNAADSLVAVGYSFSDNHVNALIRNWMAAAAHRTLTVVDPGWPVLDRERDGFRASIATAYGGSHSDQHSTSNRRIVVLNEPAGAALTRAIAATPELPSPLADAEWGANGEVIVRYYGPNLRDAAIWGPGGRPSFSVATTSADRDRELTRPRHSFTSTSARIGDLDSGTVFSVFPVLPADVADVEVRLEGQDLIGKQTCRMPLPPPPPDVPRRPEPATPTPPRISRQGQ